MEFIHTIEDLKYNRLAAGIHYAIKMLPYYKENKSLEIQNKILSAINTLNDALMNGRIAINLDGRKVSEQLAIASRS